MSAVTAHHPLLKMALPCDAELSAKLLFVLPNGRTLQLIMQAMEPGGFLHSHKRPQVHQKMDDMDVLIRIPYLQALHRY